MDLDALYEVIVDDIDIQVWCADESAFKDGIIFEGSFFKSRKAVEPYMYNRVFQIEVDNQGKLYVGIETD
jgi:hypothetical protein